MKITEHEMRGLLAGKCVPADMLVNETLSSYLVRKFFESEDTLRIKRNHITLRDGYIAELEGDNEELKDELSALQKKLDAVLAENAEIKSGIADITFMRDDDFFASTQEAQRVMGALVNIKTPATDALLNAVRAEAIEHAAEKAPWLYGDQMGRSVEAIPKEQLIKWAAQLRAETDTTSSQYESLAGGK